MKKFINIHHPMVLVKHYFVFENELKLEMLNEDLTALTF
jgi:hypothetical protein